MIRNSLNSIVYLVIFLVLIQSGYGYSGTVTHESQGDFMGGTPDGIQINYQGQLKVSHKLIEKWCSEEESACWSLCLGKQDEIFMSTGHDGKIYRHHKGETTLWFDAPQVALFSLLPFSDGDILAGAAPDGIIYRIDSRGNGSVFCRTDAHYIWDMILERDGNILVATGLPAEVIRVNPRGEILKRYAVNCDHVRCLAKAEHSEGVWIGTVSTGRIYYLEKDDLQLVHDSLTSEISDIVVDKKGIWFATVAAPTIKGSSSENPQELSARKRAGDGLDEHGNIWFMSVDNRSVQEMLLVRSAPVFAMAMWQGHPIIVCGDDGYVIQIDGCHRGSLLSSGEDQSLISLVVDSRDRLWVGSAGSACLKVMDSNPGSTGTLTSELIDAESSAEWGRLVCFGEGLNSENCVAATRTGNTEELEDTWSEWQGIGSDNKINSPPARYIQYRLTLSNGKTKPVVDSVTLSGKTANQPPYLKSVTVYPVTRGQLIDNQVRGKRYQQVLPEGIRVEYIVPNNKVHDGLSKGTWLKLKGMRTVMWESGDPDHDQLETTVRMANRSNPDRWFLLKDRIADPIFSFDSTAFPDGRYVLEVTVTDAVDHPIQDALSASLESPVFEIDNTPPEILNGTAVIVEKSESNEQWQIHLRGTARDGLSRIDGLEYSFNTEDWFQFTSSDGMLDSPEEPFDLILKGRTGEKRPTMVFLKATDAQENIITSTISVD